MILATVLFLAWLTLTLGVEGGLKDPTLGPLGRVVTEPTCVWYETFLGS